MNRMPLLIVCVLVMVTAPGSAQGPPSEAERNQLLAGMRSYAEQYVASLPNFICEQVTRQFEGGRKAKSWRTGDTLTFKLLFTHGEEQRSLELVNGAPIHSGMRRWRTPLTSEGEFGILLANVFASASGTSFAWRGWENVRGRRLAVFDYTIDAEHSKLTLSLSDLAKAVIPYHGSVYGDPATGAIWRVEDSATHLPKELDTKSMSTAIDYDTVPIGGATYLLPVEASVSIATAAGLLRNDLEFRNYRKFKTDSVIKYAGVQANESPANSPQY